ncbi:penicillin-binding transpeptidase domain-containing protein [Clostridium sp. D53t1_180928_C8]|uniref:peptidoglycan D,D-transpeptidase FtsI family protein n=1 Tax=Clostridium sp. D53t1_180928_C8 TaxID=2787101 RepID=UPI0018AB855D|nr:penicillin-binding transpeptidase domain-containing protein [Clostridium sp. D53t1_180928_C8]
MNDLAKSVKSVMTIFLIFFIALISYIAYFQLIKSPKINDMPGNTRVIATKNEVLRGTIYDRNGTPLTTSERVNETSQKRDYLYNDLYVHALGYTSAVYGTTGLEEEYDSELSTYNAFGNNFRQFLDSININGLIESMKNDKESTGSFNFSSNFKNFMNGIDFKKLTEEADKVGNGVVTTLDTTLQQVASDALGDNKGAVVALNPKTGEILAMVSKPTFNPNNLADEMNKANSGSADETPLINRAINGLYPPGSVFKTVTLTSALENIPTVVDRTFDDEGKIKFQDGTSLSNFGNNVYGSIDLKQAYKVSSNVVFGTLAMDLGNDKLKATAESYGFNSVITGPGVSITSSRFPTLNNAELGNMAQSGIGQGSVLATPMQMALVAATVANDGVMMQPKLVNSIVDKDKNTVKAIDGKELKQVMSSEIAETIQEYMTYLIDSNLNKWPAFKGTNAGGKTGTADYTLADGSEATPHSWFIAAAPMDDPQIAIAVIVENGGTGSGAAATVASKVVRQAVLGD